MVRPAIGWPARANNPATTELSTPPDMATAIRPPSSPSSDCSASVVASGRDILGHLPRLWLGTIHLIGGRDNGIGECRDLLAVVGAAQRKSHRRARIPRRKTHCQQNGGRLHR